MTLHKFSSRFFFILIILSAANSLHAMFPINLFRPWDINLRPPLWCNTKLQLTGWAEVGVGAWGFDALGKKVPVTQIWTPTQNALAMVQGFPTGSPENDFYVNVLGSPTNVGIAGQFRVTGAYHANTFGLSARYHAPHNFNIALHIPFFTSALREVNFIDLTQETTAQDVVIKDNLTSQLFAVVSQFSPTLNLGNWERAGFGDLALVVEWIRDFFQGKPVLKSVIITARGGITVPTGAKINVNDILSMPYGFDGSWGVVVGGGLNVNWWHHVRAGFDAEFIHLFGNTRTRRIKVDPAQTDFLLLAQARAFKDYGFTQRFDLHIDAFDIANSGLWAGIAYQYWRHDDDHLTLCTNAYNETIANTAEELQGWTINELIFKVGYDFQKNISEDCFFKPQFELFYKFPIVGTRSIIENTLGGTFSVSF